VVVVRFIRERDRDCVKERGQEGIGPRRKKLKDKMSGDNVAWTFSVRATSLP
jgi:hypothetical protein